MAVANPAADIPDVNSLLPSEPCTNENQRNDIVADSTNQASGVLENHDVEQHASNKQQLSKSAQKRLRKKQEWEAGREDRKIKRKKLRKARKERQREAKASGLVKSKTAPQREWSTQLQVPITLVIDCSFDSLMTENEHISLCGQINRCYHDVRNGQYRPLLAVTSFGGRMKDRFENVLHGHHERWKGVHFVETSVNSVSELAASWMKDDLAQTRSTDQNQSEEQPIKQTIDSEPAKLVYLSADSPNVLTDLEPNTCYIIGGLVDRNRHKGVCYEAARKANIPTARLPIGEYIKLSSRQVLTTNHVVEIMVKFLANHDWAKSFLEVIPTRKGADIKPPVDGEVTTDDAQAVFVDVESSDEEADESSPED